VSSPLAAALTNVLLTIKAATYRTWLQQAADSQCLDRKGVRATLIAQGAVDLPLCGTGQAAELADSFRHDNARREINMLSAVAVASDASAERPTDLTRLSRALLLAYASLSAVAIGPTSGELDSRRATVEALGSSTT